MTDRNGYGQFCRVAKAAEVITTRWTPLILRELVSGSSRFNEIHRGVPLVPRALLSKRLKELQFAGVIERRQQNEAHAELRRTMSRWLKLFAIAETAKQSRKVGERR